MIDLQGYGPSIIRGAMLTIELAFASLLVALVLGLLGATAKLSKNRLARGVALIYTTVVRGVPDLVMMMLLFYGGQILMNQFTDWLFDYFEIDIFIEINAFVAGVITIGFIFGAYMAETFRGAFLAVEYGQIEAGKAYGMSSWQVFKRIMFPQMLRHALPGLGNNWQVMLKTTALVSLIGLTDMVRVASEASRALHDPFTFFVPVAAIFLFITSLSDFAIKKIKIRYSAGVNRRL